MNVESTPAGEQVAAIAFGGNQGNVCETLRAAEQRLADVGEVIRISRLFRTSPVGAAAGDPFLNGVLLLRTGESPAGLLHRLQRIESSLGRRRTVHWGPRTLDLDILSYGNEVVSTSTLQIPHPACWYRRFVLDPWEDVDPEWVHPRLQRSVRELRALLLSLPIRMAIPADEPELAVPFRQVLRDPSAAGRIQLVDQVGGDEILLTSGAPPLSPRSIPVPPGVDRAEFFRQLVTAMTDSPTPLPFTVCP
ncbi:2-amino-4-hydroxy-6-hydroxymethyldihydropteridine diphosphokinase [Planctomicrobium sp. SH664]|uniref:2-amino-4-hydroxy-6- hydroxymethyldihydropteridine diphosphokinase n=1 Tax=Planctomicrobium sp. SH664 TaxID=3448125 RepID=UPI003F5BADCB